MFRGFACQKPQPSRIELRLRLRKQQCSGWRAPPHFWAFLTILQSSKVFRSTQKRAKSSQNLLRKGRRKLLLSQLTVMFSSIKPQSILKFGSWGWTALVKDPTRVASVRGKGTIWTSNRFVIGEIPGTSTRLRMFANTVAHFRGSVTFSRSINWSQRICWTSSHCECDRNTWRDQTLLDGKNRFFPLLNGKLSVIARIWISWCLVTPWIILTRSPRRSHLPVDWSGFPFRIRRLKTLRASSNW